MAAVEDRLLEAGAQIIWVLEQTPSFEPGTASACRAFVDSRGSRRGLCVGDSETMGQMIPSMSTWDDAPFSNETGTGRGFDLIVSRRDMVIRAAPTHGTGGANENLTGEELLARVNEVIAGL